MPQSHPLAVSSILQDRSRLAELALAVLDGRARDSEVAELHALASVVEGSASDIVEKPPVAQLVDVVKVGHEHLAVYRHAGGLFGVDASYIEQVADQDDDTVYVFGGDPVRLQDVPASGVKKYAQLSWSAEDVQAIREDWTLEQCEEALSNIQNRVRDRLCELGWDVLETLLPETADES